MCAAPNREAQRLEPSFGGQVASGNAHSNATAQRLDYEPSSPRRIQPVDHSRDILWRYILVGWPAVDLIVAVSPCFHSRENQIATEHYRRRHCVRDMTGP